MTVMAVLYDIDGKTLQSTPGPRRGPTSDCRVRSFAEKGFVNFTSAGLSTRLTSGCQSAPEIGYVHRDGACMRNSRAMYWARSPSDTECSAVPPCDAVGCSVRTARRSSGDSTPHQCKKMLAACHARLLDLTYGPPITATAYKG